MNLLNRHIKLLTLVLLVVLVRLPFSGPVFISELPGAVETSHTGFVCVHEDADSDHESQDDHRHIAHCHELDAPCDTTPPPVLDYPPVVSTLASSDKGALLHGFCAPIDIPPENRG